MKLSTIVQTLRGMCYGFLMGSGIGMSMIVRQDELRLAHYAAMVIFGVTSVLALYILAWLAKEFPPRNRQGRYTKAGNRDD